MPPASPCSPQALSLGALLCLPLCPLLQPVRPAPTAAPVALLQTGPTLASGSAAVRTVLTGFFHRAVENFPLIRIPDGATLDAGPERVRGWGKAVAR